MSETAQLTSRAWVAFAGDLGAEVVETLLATRGGDHEPQVIIAVGTGWPTDAERQLADVMADGAPPPAPYGVFAAMHAAGIHDIRRIGVVGGSERVVEAGRRAGAGAVVALTKETPIRTEPWHGLPDMVVLADAFWERTGGAWGEAVPVVPAGAARPGDASGRCDTDESPVQTLALAPEGDAATLAIAVRDLVRGIAGVGPGWDVRIVPGSGAAACEAMLHSIALPTRRLAIVQNGRSGAQLCQIALRMGIEPRIIRGDSTRPIEPWAVEAALADDPSIDTVVVVHHDPAAGLVNPVLEIAALADAHGVATVVDATGSFGSQTLPVAGTGIDLIAATADGCLHRPARASFVLVSPSGRLRISAAAEDRASAATQSAHAERPDVAALQGLLRGLTLIDAPLAPRESSARLDRGARATASRV